ncbi:hypothetical protein NHX12_000736 [Muraenolepis orangiensis]|uniref:UPAR/Ly6 domain-containing protein n=1 Tax=Muraenolepis orangiensis TaxID=630683 RepID=A0A9Q0IEC7_9TELE|nr:hypothetical protein NHX12_000736 [Muraenolepis orangiensis]
MDALPASAKILLGLGLFTLLLPSVEPISCFVCSSSPTNVQCNRSNQTCPAILDMCITIIDIAGSTTSIVKQCSSSATCSAAMSQAAVDENGNGNIVNCCNTIDFCNLSGAETAAIHKALPVLSLFLLLLVAQ